jgi:hypothetical protein
MPTADLLEDTLAALREAARDGRLADFDALASRLDDAVKALEHQPPNPARLHRLRRCASETAAILQAARQGVEAARQRLAELETLRRGLGTYGDDGRRRQLLAWARTERRV